MNLKNAIVSLGAELATERDKARDLWTWLPSHKAAERHHGDYASEFMPSVTDILTEATMFISHGLNPDAKQTKEAGDYYRCPCGEES